MLLNVMAESLLGPDLLDPVALVERGEKASRVVPAAGAEAATGLAAPPPSAPPPRPPTLPTLRDLTRPLLWTVALLLLWEIAALGLQWQRLRQQPGAALP